MISAAAAGKLMNGTGARDGYNRQDENILMISLIGSLIRKFHRTVDRIFHFANSIDWAFIIYLGIITAIIVLFKARIDGWAEYLRIHLVIFGLALFILRFFAGSRFMVLRIIHHWYPVLLFTYFYMTSGELNQVVFQGFWDPFFQDIDIAVFGVQPNIWLYEHLNNYYLNEFLHMCYFSYYLLPLGFGIYIYLTRDGEFLRILFGISITFYICYFLYIFIPAEGPIPLRAGRFQDGGWFTQTMNWIYSVAEKPGAAFPSSHVAIAFMVLCYAYRYSKIVFWLLFPFITGLIFSTMFCFYHYVIDVIAGLIMSAALYVYTNRWFDRIYRTKYFPTFH